MQKTLALPLKNFFLSLVIGGALGAIFTGYIAFGQFTEPTTNPPGGVDPAPPLTTAADSQVKDGPLILNFTSSGDDTGAQVHGYLQIDTIPTLIDPTPDPTHCDEDDERGRMILEPDNGPPVFDTSLWICSGPDGGAVWVEKT